ncbi:hypothetical protein JCM10914A_09500 [Paenibacillus sp. JCM 10914]
MTAEVADYRSDFESQFKERSANRGTFFFLLIIVLVTKQCSVLGLKLLLPIRHALRNGSHNAYELPIVGTHSIPNYVNLIVENLNANIEEEMTWQA